MNYKEEAIIRLEECIADCTSGEDDIYKSAFATAIEALRKQIPVKPIKIRTLLYVRCPSCRCEVDDGIREMEYCEHCGQKLDWSEN